MRQRTSVHKEQNAVVPRRFPRFLPQNQQGSEDPETPDIEPRAIRFPDADSTPLSSNRKLSSNKKQIEVSRRAKENSKASVISAHSSSGSRRSSRLNGQIECSKELSEMTAEKTNSSTGSRRSSRLNSQKDFTPLRRSQRLAENGSCNISRCRSCVENISRKIVLACPAINNSNKSVVKLEKRATRRSCQSEADGGKTKQDKPKMSKFEKIETFTAKSSLQVVNVGKDSIELEEKQRRAKRKRAKKEDRLVIAKGWTMEQEMALQRAYFGAKATPQFWKKVAKMVPGKSAQECFDRIHLDHLTPPQPRPRSRAKKAAAQSLSPPSASNLLQTEDGNAKKLRRSKAKGHFSQKAVREILEKQYNNRDKEVDLFSVLESTTTDQPNEAFQQAADLVTPELTSKRLSFIGRCERSSGLKEQQSGEKKLFSPPVLKPIKNKAMHDRYIDQLHCREAKRKAASLRTAKRNQDKNDRKGDHDKETNAIQAAKNALIFDARDAISQFQNLQTNQANIFYDGEDDDCGYDNDDDEGCI